jgi:hypothetical protein
MRNKRKNISRKRMGKPIIFKKSQVIQMIERRNFLAKFDSRQQANEYVDAVCNDLLEV